MKRTYRMIAVFMAVLMLVGCSGKTEEATTATEKSTTEEATAQEEATTNEETTTTEQEATTQIEPTQLEETVVDELIQNALNKMTIEEKIGQMFIANIELLDPASPESYDYQKITKKMKDTLKNYPVGGVIFFSRNIQTPKQTKTFIRRLQKVSKYPLFVSVDEEGGEIARIANNPKMKTTKFPPMAEIGATGDEEKAFEVGDTIGREIHALGFNLDFAPVADLETNPDSPEIGNRAFSDDPEVAGKMVAQVVKGLQGQNVSATLKHFPGHGSASADTHKGYANITQSIKQLREVEFVPFQAGIEAGADLIMVSHLAITSVTDNKTPASMSSLIITEILRNELGYQNLVITDALNMKAITKFYTPGEACVTAINAGADLLLMPENLEEAFDAVYQAVLEGKLDEKRIDESVTRILKIKILRGVISLEDPLLEPVKATEEEEATTAVESTTEQEKMDKKNPEKKKEVTKAKASTTEE